ncbi:MAG: xanthine dehydrogenase family protein molybdopterin-binding subunit [Candidatus Thermoplasmatota archaeon]|nr:xanthine dehydrogenase family protein molybdopterin-binding subunit [Candidatus Thermoplasmatota archaeon]MCL5794335.1 xanthine dehydrogenase family protein molybdopterin-binding subunit [Candidatus Thermoplasmatota archaeon]
MGTVEDMVRGRAKYIDDIVLPEMLHMAVVRSTYPRARILGVKGGPTHRDFPAVMTSEGETATDSMAGPFEPVLAGDYANYYGQPISAVLGKNRYEAEDLLDSVDIDYEPLTPVTDPVRALTAPPIHPERKDNVLVNVQFGNAFKPSDYEVEVSNRVINQRISNNPIETRGIIAHYQSDFLTVYSSTQSVHSMREGLSEILKLPAEKIRVIQADTGGGFGLKGGVYPEYVLAAYFSMKTGKPVKWIETRSEMLKASKAGRGVVGELTMYGKKNGTITGIRGKVIVDSGAYAGGGEFSTAFIARQIAGPYNIKHAYVEGLGVFTNKPTIGPYRGAGRPEAHFIIERTIDMLADEIGMDPVDVRLMNVSDTGITTPLGIKVPPARKFLEDGIRKLQYREMKKQKPGFAFFVLIPAFSPGESARVIVSEGRARVWLGGNVHGQRHELFVKRIVHEELGIAEDHVMLELGDTRMTPEGVGSWGSRSAMVGGLAVYEACQDIKRNIREKHGKFTTEVLLKEGADSFVFKHVKGSLNSLGCNLATAAVDHKGQVRVTSLKSYYDVGVPLSRDTVMGQVAGGAAQGIGQTLFEELAYSPDGQLLTSSIADAGVPLANQLPEFETYLADTRSDLPHGAKGVGESPTIGVPIALARAIENATGVPIRETPIRQELLVRKQ